MLSLLALAAPLATDFSPGAEFNRSFAPYAILMAGGFVIGVFGHIIRSNATIAAGIALVFLGTVVLPFLVHVVGS